MSVWPRPTGHSTLFAPGHSSFTLPVRVRRSSLGAKTFALLIPHSALFHLRTPRSALPLMARLLTTCDSHG